MLITFITEDKRVGSYHLEFQYCKTDNPIKNNKIDIDNIKHWEYDSLLINADEFNDFYKLYSDVFNCALSEKHQNIMRAGLALKQLQLF